jgi:CBS domain-containing protein
MVDEPSVKSFMLPLAEYASVRSGSSIREALEALERAQPSLTPLRHQHRAVLVVDRAGQVLGKLTHWALLRCLGATELGSKERDALARAGLPEQFLAPLEAGAGAMRRSLDRMCREAGRMRVDDALVPASESVDENAPVTEAVESMVRTHQQSLLVTRDGAAVGVLRLSDLFEVVAHAIRAGKV